LSESSTACFDSIKPKPLKLGKFTICPNHKLGKGSFSTVFLCEDANGNKAAVKILNKHSKNSEHIAKFQKAEVKILKKLKHPNIVGFLGSF
jgi:serine/threonine protein kinase